MTNPTTREPTELPTLPEEDEATPRSEPSPLRPGAPALGLLTAALVLAAVLLG